MKTRIAYLVSRYPAISHTFILREVLALRRRGFEIHPASINPPDRCRDAMTEEEQREASATYYIKSSGLSRILMAHLRVLGASPLRYLAGLFYALRLAGSDLRAWFYHFFYFVEAVALGDWMQRNQLKHVHVHFATPAATVAMLTGHICDIEYSMTVHGPDEFYEVGRYLLAEKIRRARFVCAIGRYCRSQLMKVSEPEHWHKFELSPLGVDPELFRPVPQEKTADEYRLICVGRLVAAKGQAILLEAISRLRQNQHRVSLTLVGDGPDRAGLERMTSELGISGCVHFTGAVNQDHIRKFYRQADAFVLPSFAEGIPVVLMEAMAMGIPCISTAITGIPELIDSGSEGILVPASDSDLLAEAIALLKDRPEVAERFAVQGRQKVCRDYNLEINSDRLAEILHRRLQVPSSVIIKERVIA
jgi:glycosyltransferase involved in cell wall biosynthesis